MSQKTILTVATIILITGATAYFYLQHQKKKLQGVTQQDKAELKKITIE